jgi:hypothetical protein
MEPLCERCGTDAAGGPQEAVDDYRVRCGSCGDVFVPYEGWDPQDELERVRGVLVSLERRRAREKLPQSLESARRAAFTLWLNLAWCADRDDVVPAHQIEPVTMHDGVRWELDGRTSPQIVPTAPAPA